MPVIKLTEADLAKTKTLESNWYPATIVKISDWTKSKDGVSMNVVFTFRVDAAAAAGKELDHYFNTKLLGMITPLVEAVSGQKATPGEVNTDAMLMKQIDIHLVTDTYNGNLQNKIDNFLPLGKGTAGPAY